MTEGVDALNFNNGVAIRAYSDLFAAVRAGCGFCGLPIARSMVFFLNYFFVEHNSAGFTANRFKSLCRAGCGCFGGRSASLVFNRINTFNFNNAVAIRASFDLFARSCAGRP